MYTTYSTMDVMPTQSQRSQEAAERHAIRIAVRAGKRNRPRLAVGWFARSRHRTSVGVTALKA